MYNYHHFYPTPELAKISISKLIPKGTIIEGNTRKKIIGYRKYGNESLGYKYVPTYRILYEDNHLGKSIGELHSKDIEEYLNIKSLGNILKF